MFVAENTARQQNAISSTFDRMCKRGWMLQSVLLSQTISHTFLLVMLIVFEKMIFFLKNSYVKEGQGVFNNIVAILNIDNS